MSSGGSGQGGPRRVLDGRYRLEEVIGRGGMSTVYRGTDLALDRVVAVKVALDPLAEENPVYVARFKREARAAAALNHPGAVTVYDAGADGPTRFIVMEYVEGQSLAELLRETKPNPLEPRRAARIAEQVADTLAAAHAAGIVHRDIKPGNIMVGPGDRVTVLDFGIARTADAVTLTQTASVLGTAPYMAPEQAMGNPADARSDIYSLGCVLYEMLTGQPPFMADVPAAVLHQHVRVAPKPASSVNPAVPPALDALVLQMLAKNPEDRPQSAAEVRDRLAAFETPTAPTRPLAAAEAPPVAETLATAAAAAADVPQVATAAQPATIPPQASAPTTVLPPPQARRSGRGPWAVLAVTAVVLLGAAVAYAVAGGSATSHSSSASSHPSVTATVTATKGATSRATSTPTTTPSSSTSTSTSSSSTASTATTTVTTTTTASSKGPGGGPPAPPGHGGTPPGQAKKGPPTQ